MTGACGYQAGSRMVADHDVEACLRFRVHDERLKAQRSWRAAFGPLSSLERYSSWPWEMSTSVSGAVLVNTPTLERWQLVQTTTVAIACTTSAYALLFSGLSACQGIRAAILPSAALAAASKAWSGPAPVPPRIEGDDHAASLHGLRFFMVMSNSNFHHRNAWGRPSLLAIAPEAQSSFTCRVRAPRGGARVVMLWAVGYWLGWPGNFLSWAITWSRL